MRSPPHFLMFLVHSVSDDLILSSSNPQRTLSKQQQQMEKNDNDSLAAELSQQQQDYVQSLESRLSERSNILEEKHMEAAIDAELINAPCCNVTTAPRQEKNRKGRSSSIDDDDDDDDDKNEEASKNEKKPIFDDYTNPNSVKNCLSPYVPTSAQRIAALVHFCKLQSDDVFLDIGCGDGRVCIAASKLTASPEGGCCCRAIGLDVSPLCIQMAKQVALEEGLDANVEFYQTDATVDPHILLLQSDDDDNDDSSYSRQLAQALQAATVVYLYTYPTLLLRLTPLLAQLIDQHKVRAIVTLTYHLPETTAKADAVNVEHNFKLYTKLHSKSSS